MYVGGAAVPQALIEAFEKRYGLRIYQAWGMTEMAPLGTVAHCPPSMTGATDAVKFAYRATQGRPAPFVEIRARNEDGLVPWDGKTMGELEVRGPWIASAYYNRPDSADRFTDDGWFKTGDIVTIDRGATIQVQDRTKDLIKSGGEWISSVALECALMGHPSVAEAAVIPVASEKWSERPLAAVVLKPGAQASPAELKAFLAPSFSNFWLPDAFEFVEAIPRTSAGKFKKSELRERFKDYRAAE
jgi:fatty-acyl-CoA synthase